MVYLFLADGFEEIEAIYCPLFVTESLDMRIFIAFSCPNECSAK